MFKTFTAFCVISFSLFAKQPLLIGIAGGTGSGKTTLAEKVHTAFAESTLISQDAYYKNRIDLSIEERERLNFDHPDSLEFSLLRKHLIDLKNGISIQQPLYSFHTHLRDEETRDVEPASIILVEGILLLAAPEVRDLFDIKIFVDTEDDIRLIRRIERDIQERSRDFKGIKEQYLATVKPMHDLFVEPSRRYADIIVPGDKENEVAMSLILAKLREYL